MSWRRRVGLFSVVSSMVVVSTVFPLSAAEAAPKQQCLPPPLLSVPTVPWAQKRLAAHQVWQFTKGEGQIVGVVDTGVDAGAAQLSGRVLPGVDVRVNGSSKADNDCFGHGTFVAGIVAAAPVPTTPFSGIAPAAQVLPIRIADNSTDTSPDALAKGIRAAVDLGAKVINVSASTNSVDPEIDTAVDYATAKDVLIVASAGNSAEQGNPTPYPASEGAVIAVGAVDSAGLRAQFSQTGKYLSLAAPGVDVASLGPGGPGQWQASGTSYAAPFVTGVAVLVRAYHPHLTAAQVKHRLEVTADRPPANVPDPGLGWGIVNPMTAVTAILPEENAGATASARAPGTAPRPDRPSRDVIGDLLVASGLFLAMVIIGAVLLAVRLGPTGTRRKWAPARRVVIAEPKSEPEAATALVPRDPAVLA
ncbi:type VII secretion-associated serine protease mycosin [Lentzea sp. JNUCC 0626]|uniref:type VII secretion-associated serine protease mycosin n=1 Tax=Lentzea sp. JNUCC 0626 TaxID=3367513 RepID=UPI0037496469